MNLKHLAIVFFAMAACTFEPDGSYVNPNVKPPAATIPASIDIDKIDGVYPLFRTTFFRVTPDLAGKKQLSIKVSGVDHEIVSQRENYFFVQINPEKVPDGTHEVKVEMVLASGSGSLADAAGLERYVVTRTFSIEVDRTTPPPATGLSAQLLDGYLRISWDNTSDRNFVYGVTKQTGDGTFIDYFDNIDAAASYIVDSAFVGGSVKYYVTKQSFAFSVESQTVTFALNPISVEGLLAEDGRLQLKWEVKADIPGGVINVSQGGRSTSFHFANAEAIVDTLYLGDTTKVTVAVAREGFESSAYKTKLSFHRGKLIRPFDFCAAASSSGSDLITNKSGLFISDTYYTKLYKYKGPDFNSVDSITFPLFGFGRLLVSRNGMYGYVQEPTANFETVFFDPQDFTKPVIKYSLNTIFRNKYGRNLEWATDFNVSNDNLISFVSQGGSGALPHSVVTVDMNTQTIWGTLLDGSRATLSADGQYLAVANYAMQRVILYKRGASNWEQYASAPLFGESVISSGSAYLIVSDVNGKAISYDITSGPDINGMLRQLGSAELNMISYDPYANNLLSQSLTNLYSEIRSFTLPGMTPDKTFKACSMNVTHYVVGNVHVVTSGYIERVE